MNSLILQDDLRKAVEEGAFEVHYQPIIELSDGRVSGLEALVRWPHPVHGMISPWVFIPLAEEMGLTAEIGLWVVREACQRVRAWQDRYGMESLSVSVNTSGQQFESGDAADRIAAAIRETGLAPRHLKLEIVEGVLKDETVRINLQKLRDLGVQIHVDDFGLDPSSLAQLQRFPVDAIKIDPSIIGTMIKSRESAGLVQIMITVAEKLGMPVIAENVETEEQLERLRSLRCSHGQGYLFSKSLSPQGAMDYLSQRKGSTGSTAPFALSS